MEYFGGRGRKKNVKAGGWEAELWNYIFQGGHGFSSLMAVHNSCAFWQRVQDLLTVNYGGGVDSWDPTTHYRSVDNKRVLGEKNAWYSAL